MKDKYKLLLIGGQLFLDNGTAGQQNVIERLKELKLNCFVVLKDLQNWNVSRGDYPIFSVDNAHELNNKTLISRAVETDNRIDCIQTVNRLTYSSVLVSEYNPLTNERKEAEINLFNYSEADVLKCLRAYGWGSFAECFLIYGECLHSYICECVFELNF